MKTEKNNDLDLLEEFNQFVKATEKGKRAKQNGTRILKGSVVKLDATYKALKGFSDFKDYPLKIKVFKRTNTRENLKQWILFGSTGTFSSNMPEFKSAVSYELIDSINLKFNVPSQQPETRLFFYNTDTSTNVLTLSPADPICFEGCCYKFER